MKILLTVQNLYPINHSGICVNTYFLAREMASAGHEVKILTSTMEPHTLPPLGVRRQKVSFGEILWIHQHRWTALQKWMALNKLFEAVVTDWRPDIVHFVHLHTLSPFWPFLAKRHKIPSILHLRDFWYLCPTINLFHRDQKICEGPGWPCALCVGGRKDPIRFLYRHLKYLPRKAILRRLANFADGFFASSQFCKNIYVALGWPENKIVPIHHGFTLFSNGKNPSPQRPQNPGKVRFGFLGGFASHKGASLLLEAFSKIPEPHELLLFGRNTKDTEKLKKMSENNDRIQFQGPYNHDDLRHVFSLFDVLVAPTISYESFGNVIQEGLALKKPLIASRTGGFAEQIVHGVNGLLFERQNPFDLTKNMKDMIRNFEVYKNRFQFDRNLKSIEDAAPQFLKAYTNLIKNPKKSGVTFFERVMK